MKRKKYSLINNLIFFYRYLYRYDKWVVYKQLLYVISSILLPLFTIYLPKVMLDCVEKKVSAGYLLGILGSFIGLMVVFDGAAGGLDSGTYLDRNFSRNFLMADLFRKFRRVPYRYTEDGEYLNKYKGGWRNIMDAGDWSASSRFYSEAAAFIIRFCCFFAYSAVIGSLTPLILLLLVVLTAARYGMKEWERRYRNGQRPKQDNLYRKIQYVKNASENPEAAKDIRIFGLRSWLGSETDSLLQQKKKMDRTIAARTVLQESGGYLLELVRDVIVYGWLVAQTMNGQMSAGDFMLYLGAVTGFGNFLNMMVGSMQALQLANDQAQVFLEYLDLPDEETAETGDKEREDLPELLSIDFEDVSFSYEEGGKNVLSHFTLHIEPGQKIALVGENGAGKSTLVKLLTGLYQPKEGRILIGGVDIRELKVKERYGLFSAVFQETAYFPFTVGENLTLKPQEKVDEKRAWQALDQAGLGDKFRKKGIGLGDYMTKYYLQDGIELSGGEMQRFMMARALYKDGPILLLDEPTAALDPIAESEVYQAYAQMTKEKTAIFISHRLASTRFSDRIVLIKDGMIAESGTHEELLKMDGEYAAMFKLQASYYKEETKEVEADGIEF